MKNFIQQSIMDAVNQVKSGSEIPPTIINLAERESDQVKMVSVHHFEMPDIDSAEEHLEAMNQCIKSAERRVGQDGLRSLCSVFAESRMREDDPILFIQTKDEAEEISEIHLFENPFMHVSESGELITEYDETIIRYKHNEN